MNKSTKFFIKIFCGIILCLATCGCAKQSEGTESIIAERKAELETTPELETTSEVIAVETVSDQVPSSVALGDDWCYLRFNVSREQLESISNTINEYPDNEIFLSLPGCTPDNDPFFIKISHRDVEESLKLLDKQPEQESINLIKRLSADVLSDFEEPDPNLHHVYYLLTEEDIARMLDYLKLANGDALILKQYLNIHDDNLAEFGFQRSMLEECINIFRQTGQPYIVYVCQVEPLETI